MGFWILAISAAAVTVAILARALVATKGETTSTAAFDVQVYRDQLKELERDLARGVIGAEEAERTRIEISRRLLEADRKAQAGESAEAAPQGATLAVVAVTGAALIGGGAWLYADLGAPGYWDMPLETRISAAQELRETRPSQAEAEADMPAWEAPPEGTPEDYITLVDQLREAVSARPDDPQGQMLLATHETGMGNYVAARAAMERLIALRGASASAEEYSQYADLLVLAAGGYVSPEAEAALNRALAINPRDPVARYYAGLLYAQIGRPDLAFPIWRDLLAASPASEPWVPPLRAQIEAIAAMAGVNYTLPPAQPVPGPDAADLAAAEDMTEEERAEMVAGMVSRLMDRLATEGGPATDWARLIQALGVQGDTERARAIWGEAQTVFAARPADLALVARAAAEAGLDTSGVAEGAMPALPGPSAEDVAAAAGMSAEDRALMIDGMITRLADKIGSEGGTPEEWARLITSYGVVGEAELAARAYANGQAKFEGDMAALEVLRAAATAAGVAE